MFKSPIGDTKLLTYFHQSVIVIDPIRGRLILESVSVRSGLN